MKRLWLALVGGVIALVSGVIVVASSLVVLLLAVGYFLGTHTPYCPWSHKISDTSVCLVLDRKGERILIQHADLDSNKNFLELRDGQSSRIFQMPGFITQSAPQGYSAEIIEGDGGAILINGERQDLEPLGDF